MGSKKVFTDLAFTNAGISSASFVDIATDYDVVSLGIQGAVTQNFSYMHVETGLGLPIFEVDNSGNVGIGTSTPSTNLEIRETGDASLRVRGTDNTSNAFVQITPGISGVAILNLGSAIDVNDGKISYDVDGQYLSLFTANIEAVRVDSSGRVGVGTINPLVPLHITGNAIISGQLSLLGEQLINLQAGSEALHAVNVGQLNDTVSGVIGGGGGDHGALAGLGDDDHTQYLLVTGLRSMSGDLDLGGFQINNVVSGSLLTDATNVHQVNVAVSGHATDGTIHFTEGGISHLNISDIGTNSHASIDTHIADGTIHFTEGGISHLNISDIGTNSHASIDTHIADGTIHFTEGSISHTNIVGLSSDDHTQYIINDPVVNTRNVIAPTADVEALTVNILNGNISDCQIWTDDVSSFISRVDNTGGFHCVGLDAQSNIITGLSDGIALDHATSVGQVNTIVSGHTNIVDPHTAYLLIDGTRSMTGPIDMDSNYIIGGINPGQSLLLRSTVDASLGSIVFGAVSGMYYDEANDRLGIGTISPSHQLHIVGNGTNEVLRLEGIGSFGSQATILFGDANLTYIDEEVDDYIRIYGDNGVRITGGTVHTIMMGDTAQGLNDAKVHITQGDDTAAFSALKLEQLDDNEPLIDFVGISASDSTKSISSNTGSASAITGKIRIAVSGIVGWIRIYADAT